MQLVGRETADWSTLRHVIIRQKPANHVAAQPAWVQYNKVVATGDRLDVNNLDTAIQQTFKKYFDMKIL